MVAGPAASKYSRLLAMLLLLSVVLGWRATAVFAETPVSKSPEVLGVQRIWERSEHNAFTDLVRWHGRFYCAFREGQGHAGDRGKLRVLASTDGDHWQSAGLLSLPDHDLRDAAISVTPDDRLMLLGGAQQVRDGVYHTGTSVSYSADGQEWTSPRIVIPLGRWLWRVTWFRGVAYGVTYGPLEGEPTCGLLRSNDGSHFETIVPRLRAGEERPSEARLRFTPDGACYCLLRRDGASNNTALLGTARPPYQQWAWHDLGVRLGGPNFLQIPDGRWIAAGRLYDGGARTELGELDVSRGEFRPLVRLPSGGDTSYPGLVWHDDTLWISYYSSHEERTSIYLARVRF